MATPTTLLATRAICNGCSGRRHIIDAARLFGLGAEHALAEVANLCTRQHGFGLNLRDLLARLGQFAVVAQLHPLHSFNGPRVQRPVLPRLHLQLNALAPADADKLDVEGRGSGALADRRRLYTTVIRIHANTGTMVAVGGCEHDRNGTRQQKRIQQGRTLTLERLQRQPRYGFTKCLPTK